MSKSTKFLMSFFVLLILQASTVFANDVPHIVPTLNCPEGETCCPAVVYCSYAEGCGDTGNWMADGQALSSFAGVKKFELTNIQASVSSVSRTAKTYWYYCNYQNKETGGYLDLIDSGYTLIGNWEYSGFGNENAKCKSINPLDCTATKINSGSKSILVKPMTRLKD